MEVQQQAYAKLNLGLDVLSARADGYHNLRMVMQTVSLCDDLILRATDTPGITLELQTDPELAGEEDPAGKIPEGQDNLAFQAARLLMEEFDIRQGVAITLKKRIPAAAGLAGGSADAAAVLRGINKLFSLGLPSVELMGRGKSLGADVPFCVMGGTALAEGIGERLSPLSKAPHAYVVLAKPPVSVSTGKIYGKVDSNPRVYHPDIDSLMKAIGEGDLYRMADYMGNTLQQVTNTMYPVVGELIEELRRLGAAGSMMSGSGPTVFGLFEDRQRAGEAFRTLSEDPRVRNLYLTEFR